MPLQESTLCPYCEKRPLCNWRGKPGKTCGGLVCQKAYYRMYMQVRSRTPERKAYLRDYIKTPKSKAARKAFRQTPEQRALTRSRRKARRDQQRELLLQSNPLCTFCGAHPVCMWRGKPGATCGINAACRKAYNKAIHQTPKCKASEKYYRQTPKAKAKAKAYRRSEKGIVRRKAYMKSYRQTPKKMASVKSYMRNYNCRARTPPAQAAIALIHDVNAAIQSFKEKHNHVRDFIHPCD